MPIALLHEEWKSPLDRPSGLFHLSPTGHMPGGWGPRSADYDPKAIPTPYARAETMRLLLAHLDEAAGHPYLERFRLMLLGVVLGHLRLEVLDLETPAFDNFGAALRRVEPARGFRYLGRLISTDGPPICFGYSHPDSLFWPHARRSKEDWGRLAERVRPEEPDALTLLADYKQLLEGTGAWRAHEPTPWQRGVAWVLSGHPASPGNSRYHGDSRHVGPVLLSLRQPDGSHATEPAYLPVRDEGFAQRFVQYCMTPPRGSAGAVELCRGETVLARIAIPPASESADPVALGAGVVTDSKAPRAPLSGPGQPRVKELRTLLAPVLQGLARHGRVDGDDAVRRAPFLFPDPVRVLVSRGLWGGAPLQYTTRCNQVAFGPGGPGSLPDLGLLKDTPGMGAVLPLGGQDGASLVLVERIGALEVGDLRALGYVLFEVFAGGELLSGGMNVLGKLGDGTTGLLSEDPRTPLEPIPGVYQLVLAGGGAMRARLATLQRFVTTYAAAIEAPGADAAARVAHEAAQAFAVWASGGQLKPLGRPGVHSVQLRFAGGGAMRVARDALATGAR